MKRVVYIVSDIDKSIGFEWIAEGLDPKQFNLSFVLLNDKPSYLGKWLTARGIKVYEFPIGGKWRWPLMISKIMGILRKEKADVIHTHMYQADIIGQLAGRIRGVKKRVYTRHSSNESKKYHNKNFIDKLVNSLCSDVVAISENVKNILIEQEKIDPAKVHLIHHGLDLKRFENVPSKDIEILRAKYNTGNKHPVIGVIARYSHWKGIQYTIDAFAELLKYYPNALLIMANAKMGDYKDALAEKLKLLSSSSYEEIVFEPDLFALYQLFDVYVHVPIDPELEAFGLTYVEALAAGIPSVFTPSGVAREFIQDGKNALLVNFKDSSSILTAIKKILSDKELCKSLSDQGKKDVQKLFSLDGMIAKLETVYGGTRIST